MTDEKKPTLTEMESAIRDYADRKGGALSTAPRTQTEWDDLDRARNAAADLISKLREALE